MFESRAQRTRKGHGGFWRIALPVGALGVVGFFALAIGLSGTSSKVGADTTNSNIVKVPIPGATRSLAVNATESVGIGTRPAIRSVAIRPASIAATAPAGHVKEVAVSSQQLETGLAAKAPISEPGALTFPVQMPDSEPVELTFSQAAWVDIRHKDGEKLLYGNQKANKSMVLNAVTPVQVVIGNPEGVKMWFRGEAVDLGKRSRKGVSRFELK